MSFFMIYDNFLKLCNSVGKSPSAVALELGISKSTVSHWKHQRNEMTAATAFKIANYFGITIEELKTGTKNEPSDPKDEEVERNDAVSDLRDNVLYHFPESSTQDVSALMSAIEGTDLTVQQLIGIAQMLKQMSPADRKFVKGIFDEYVEAKREI